MFRAPLTPEGAGVAARAPAKWLAAALVAAAVALSGCADVSDESSSDEGPAHLVEIEGTDVKEVVLTEKAVQRLDIQTQPTAAGPGAQIVPYASIVYDENGNTWVYTTPKPLTFVRAPVTVASITGEQAMLAAGPGVGTPVVTVGTAELFGTEQEIGQDGGH